ncbi:MAG: hypothetical protein ABIV50_10195, partial [Opitutus sp.]
MTNPLAQTRLPPLATWRTAVALLAATTLSALSFAAEPATPIDVPIGWLGGTPAPVSTGVSFGVPSLRGAVQKTDRLVLATADGRELPTQTWPLAYWPDGSIKWTGVATVAGPELTGGIRLARAQTGTPLPNSPAIKINRSDTTFEIDTGRIQVRVPKGATELAGREIIRSIVVDGREVARGGRLVGIAQNGPDGEPTDTPARESLESRVDRVTLEQSGPVRAVVKIEGVHLGAKSRRAWLPFVVRLYFYAGQDSIRLVHTFFFDGDDNRDFIRGLGLTFAVPMREEIQNRHVRFSGENDGLWSEPIQPMIGRGGRFVAKPGTVTSEPRSGVDVYPQQVEGQRVPNRAEVDARGNGLLTDWAVWDDFKLVQPNADGFTIYKRTNPESVWLHAGAGQRASGLVFVGDVSGGLAVSVKNFWQSHPSSLEVRHAGSGAAELTAWLWSPDAPAMDLRHYDTRAHGLEAVYEDVQPGFSTAHGVARTSELTLFPTAGVPSKADTALLAQVGAAPPVLVCTPQYLHDAEAFGHWGLEDRSTPVKTAIEDRLARTLNFYLTQPEQQRWYGFWDFGDVMHSYDDERHTWRYDLGGMAWANSELGPDMWLWYS